MGTRTMRLTGAIAVAALGVTGTVGMTNPAAAWTARGPDCLRVMSQFTADPAAPALPLIVTARPSTREPGKHPGDPVRVGSGRGD